MIAPLAKYSSKFWHRAFIASAPGPPFLKSNLLEGLVCEVGA